MVNDCGFIWCNYILILNVWSALVDKSYWAPSESTVSPKVCCTRVYGDSRKTYMKNILEEKMYKRWSNNTCKFLLCFYIWSCGLKKMKRIFKGWIRIQICMRHICLVGVFSGWNSICTGQRHLNWPIFYLSAGSDAKMWNWCFFCDLDTDLFLHMPLHPRLHMSTVPVWSAQVTKCMFVATLVRLFIKYQSTCMKNTKTFPCGILIWLDTNVLKSLTYQNFLAYKNFGWYFWCRMSRTFVYLSVLSFTIYK